MNNMQESAVEFEQIYINGIWNIEHSFVRFACGLGACFSKKRFVVQFQALTFEKGQQGQSTACSVSIQFQWFTGLLMFTV